MKRNKHVTNKKNHLNRPSRWTVIGFFCSKLRRPLCLKYTLHINFHQQQTRTWPDKNTQSAHSECLILMCVLVNQLKLWRAKIDILFEKLLTVTITINNVTYAVRNVTITIKNVTYTVRNVTITIKNVTYTVRNVTITIKNVTYTVRNVTITIKNVTKAIRNVTITIKNVTYAIRIVTTTTAYVA